MRNRDVRVGQKVIVYRKLTGQAGWLNIWNNEMDRYVGKTFTVDAPGASTQLGVTVKESFFKFPSGALKRAPKDTPQAL